MKRLFQIIFFFLISLHMYAQPCFYWPIFDSATRTASIPFGNTVTFNYSNLANLTGPVSYRGINPGNYFTPDPGIPTFSPPNSTPHNVSDKGVFGIYPVITGDSGAFSFNTPTTTGFYFHVNQTVSKIEFDHSFTLISSDGDISVGSSNGLTNNVLIPTVGPGGSPDDANATIFFNAGIGRLNYYLNDLTWGPVDGIIFALTFPDNCIDIINTYTPVLAFEPCTNKLTVEDASTFNTGDTVLLIQMKGAVIDSSNTSNFGTITDYKNAGNYEFNYVKSKTGNIIEFKNNLTRQYDIPNGKVQLVRVPYYKNINITSALTSLPWDGRKGGVLALNVQDTIILNADIDVSGKGFRGGIAIFNTSFPEQCDIDSFYLTNNIGGNGSAKGEGIFLNIRMSGGRGKAANGGGGGNAINSGGAGGGNGGQGGDGGKEWVGCSDNFINGGVGGLNLSYSNTLNRVYLGGGGGAGHAENFLLGNGGNGGGIVIIKTNYLKSNSKNIRSDGETPVHIIGEQDDGRPGGGAGGTILINYNELIDPASLSAKGGNGDNCIAIPDWYHGPGGGGSGGIIWINKPVNDPLLIATISGGIPGTNINIGNNPWGATAGQNGTRLLDLVLPIDSIPGQHNIDSVRIRDSATSCNSYYFEGLAYPNVSQVNNWQWYFGDGNVANTQITNHSYTGTGTYTVKLVVSDDYGCKDSSMKTVVGSFQISPHTDTAICAGNNVTLSVTFSQSDNDTILPPGSQFEYTFNTPPINWTTTTGGWTLGNAPFGNESNGSPPEFNYNTYWPTNVPEGADGFDLHIRRIINLAGYDPFTIRWYVGVDNGFVLYVNGIPVDSAFEEGYTYRWEYSGSIPGALLNPGNNIIAVGLQDNVGSTAFDMMITGELINPGVSVLWSTGDTTTTINVTPGQTTTYYVTVTNGSIACNDSVKITVKAPSFQSITASVCQGESYAGYTASGTYRDTLVAINGCDSVRTINLTVKTRSFSTITQTVCEGQTFAGYTANGTYIDTLVAINGCDSIRTLYLTVMPIIQPYLGADTTLCTGDSLKLYPGSFSSYNWQNGSTQNTLIVKHGGLYSVTVTDNCHSANDDILVTDHSCDIYFPSAFTPNNDGKNDWFKILGGYNLQGYHLAVYNRWGEKVFETSDYSKGWDGNINGRWQPSSTFVWFCEFRKPGYPGAIRMKGTVTLVR